MRVAVISLLFSATVLAAGAERSADRPLHEARWAEVDLSAPLPEDLLRPEGRTRWDLAEVVLGSRYVVRVSGSEDGAAGLVEARFDTDGVPHRPAARFRPGAAGDEAERWLLPQRDAALLAVRDPRPIELIVERGREVERRWIRTERVGLGWIDLPSGPREVVLQRALVLRGDAGGEALRPDRLIHRWIDPRAGVVAVVEGPSAADGRRRLRVSGAAVVEQVTLGDTPLKLYVDQLDRPIRAALRLGYDRERRCSQGGNLCRTTGECAGGSDVCAEIPVSILTPQTPATIGDLVAASAWDFSGNNLSNFPDMEEIASMTVEVSAEQTSAFGECGFAGGAARKISREDKNFRNPNVGTGDGDWNIIASVTERTGGIDTAADLWLRAAIKNEGVPGSGFTSESRTCHDPATGRTAVPNWRFAHQDAGGWYMDFGDTWANATPFNCEQTIFAVVPLFPDMLWVKSCSDLGGLAGEQRGTVVNEGPVTLPSGHTFNAVVVRNVVEYCAYGSSTCNNLVKFQAVRVVLHLWEVPFLGTVVRLMSGTAAPSVTGFSTLDETDIKYGLFPPRAITVGGTGSDSVDLSWDPGRITDHIDRYRIYWDTVSGATTGGAYAFDSETHPAQVSFTGPTSATVSGLAPGIEHFFTVTAITDYCPPALCANNPCSPTCPNPATGCGAVACNVVRSIESLMFPLQVTDGSELIPAEVSATPGGTCPPPQDEVGGVTVGKVEGGIEICWELLADPCVDGYRILGADTPEAAENFSVVVDDTGLTNCAVLDPTQTYFLVIGKGPGGSGPWGHYDR